MDAGCGAGDEHAARLMMAATMSAGTRIFVLFIDHLSGVIREIREIGHISPLDTVRSSGKFRIGTPHPFFSLIETRVIDAK